MQATPGPTSPIRDVMQAGIATVGPEMDLASFQEFLTVEEIGGAPVLDQHGRLCGIASKTDIVRALADDPTIVDQDSLRDVTVGDIMTGDPIAVSAREAVGEVARKMVEAGVHRVIVVDDGQIVGIVTTFDLLRALY